jgi:hypothetical protein
MAADEIGIEDSDCVHKGLQTQNGTQRAVRGDQIE